MRKLSYILVLSVFMVHASGVFGQEKKDTTKIKMGKKEIIIIDEDEEESIRSLENGKLEFEYEIEALNDSLEQIEIELRDVETEARQKKLEEKQKDYEKQIRAYEKGIEEIEEEIAELQEEIEEEEELEKELEEEEEEEFEFDWDDDDFDFKDIFPKRKKKSTFNGHWSGFELGLNNYLNSDNELGPDDKNNFMDLNESRSIAVSINFFEYNMQVRKNNIGFLTGMGFDWKNYFFDNDMTLTKVNGEIQAMPANAELDKNKLMTTYLTIPLIFEIQSGNKNYDNRFYIGIGAIGSVKLYSRLKQKYDLDNQTYKTKIKGDYYQNTFKYGATLRIGISKLRLFANYNLTPLFEKDRGPELYPVTIGLSLINF